MSLRGKEECKETNDVLSTSSELPIRSDDIILADELSGAPVGNARPGKGPGKD